MKKVQQKLKNTSMKSNNKNSSWSFYCSRKCFISGQYGAVIENFFFVVG